MLMMVIIVPIITITIRAMRISNTQSRPKNTRTTAMAVSTIQFRSTAPNRYRTAPNRAATHRTEINRSATPASTPPPLPPPTLHLSNPSTPLHPSPPCGVGPVVFLVGPAPPVGGSVFYRGMVWLLPLVGSNVIVTCSLPYKGSFLLQAACPILPGHQDTMEMIPAPPPPLWCGVVVGCFPPPPVVWCGCGLLPPSLWCGVVWVWALVVPLLPPLWRGVALHVWICLGYLVNPCS